MLSKTNSAVVKTEEILTLDLRLIEYFVAVAELEHVGKAAERLHISQSPLSRQIRHLENELQLELFVRERQRVRLTESGRWLLNQAHGLLAHVEKVRDEAQQRSRGQLGTLSIGFTSAALWSGILPKVLRRFQSEFPSARVNLQSMRSVAQLEAVRAARIDIGFTSTSATGSDIETRCVSEEDSMLVAPDTHLLAKKRRIVPLDLEGIRWILLSDSFSSDKQDRFFAVCTNAGFMPRIVQRVLEPFTFLALVEGGMGIGLIRSSARNYAPRSLIFRVLPWFSFKSRTYMVRPINGRQPLADAFAAYMPAVDDGMLQTRRPAIG